MTAAEAARTAREMLGPTASTVKVDGRCVVLVDGAELARGSSWTDALRAAFLAKTNAATPEDFVVQAVQGEVKVRKRAKHLRQAIAGAALLAGLGGIAGALW